MITQVTLNDKFKYGIKRTCRSCGVNFYDLNKHPSECPNCGAIYELHVSARGRRFEEDEVSKIMDTAVFDVDEEVSGVAVNAPRDLVEDDFDTLISLEDAED